MLLVRAILSAHLQKNIHKFEILHVKILKVV